MSTSKYSSAVKRFLRPYKHQIDWAKNQHFEIQYVDIHPLKDSKFTAVFFHGAGNDLFYPNLDFFDGLLKNNIRVISFDLPGHGINSKGLFDQNTLSNYCELIENTISKQVNRSQLIFIGYSLGSFFACYLAKSFQKPAILIGCPLKIKVNNYKSVFYECVGFIKSLTKTNFYNLINIMPAILFFNRKKFPFRRKQSDIIQLVSTFNCNNISIIENYDNKLMVFGHNDTISPASNYSYIQKKNKFLSYPDAHFALIFSRSLVQDILQFLNENKSSKN